MKRLFEKYSSDLKGLFWLALGLFLAASLVSYSPNDPSLNSIVQAAGKPKNLCGYLGSFLADLLYQGFGLPAWVLVLGSLRQSWIHFVGRLPRKEKASWWLDVVLLLVVTCLMGLHFSEARFFGGQMRVGGWVGHFLAKGLVKAVNEVGLAIVLWTCLAALLVFLYGPDMV
ncbi:MAG: hypothetical protein HC902_06315 [Calothrix sp. SM1_5_4]|nr:hypothetical protein [Calothrix sp. SM1_5_4]